LPDYLCDFSFMLKFFELNSIRYRMLSGFLFLTLLILVIGLVSISSLDNTSRVASIHSRINQLQVYTLNLIKTDNDFFDFETTNENYFRNHQSELLSRRDSLLLLIRKGLEDTRNKSEENSFPFSNNLKDIDSLFQLYNEKFALLESLIFKRGFKDFGLEGETRKHAHALELPQMNVDLIDVLSLRRHEKDFLLRHDTAYLVRFNEISKEMLDKFIKDSARYRQALFHIRQYKRYFNERATIEKQIGLSSLEGLRTELNLLTTQLSNHYFTLSEYSGDRYESIQRNARIFYVIMITGAILFSLISSFWISKKLSEPIAKLSKWMNSVTGNPKKVDVNLNNAAEEINTLTSSFIKLMDQTNDQMREIEDKSKMLKTRNKELSKLNKELDSFLYSTAHDLRSPLTSLLGIVRLMRLENRQEELHPYLDMMQGSIQRQEDFIAQIVNYAKNKKLEIAPEKLDLKKLILEIFQNHEFVEHAAEIEKYIHVREDAPFYSDRNRIHILFNNLISNAIRYCDPEKKEKYIQIRIHITSALTTIEFADNGLGIEKQHLNKIFDMFYRANFKSKGSGLGLFIFKEAIQKLNGLVTVESEEKIGAKFFLQLPNLLEQQKLQPDLPLKESADLTVV
jgi:signal transduction histidine kinase